MTVLSLFKIILVSLLIFSCISTKPQNAIKRSLIEREKEYFKKQPMSSDLKEFIGKFRSANNNRKKRSEALNEDTLYVIQDGQLVPLKNAKNSKRSEEKSAGFTVVPLVIPLNSQLQPSKLLKIRDLNEELHKAQRDAATGAPLVNIPAPSTVISDIAPSAKSADAPSSGDDDNDTNRTQEETRVLHKILEDVEGLMQYRSEGNKKEGVICNLNGSWISEAAGMRFDICYKPETRKKFRIHIADRIPPNEDGFLCDGNWTVFGELPFQHSGVVIALAVHEKDKHIATFIGECRVCEGSETVTGTWLIGRSSRDCKDQKASHKVLSDVWKREQTHSLQKKHLRELGIKVDDDD